MPFVPTRVGLTLVVGPRTSAQPSERYHFVLQISRGFELLQDSFLEKNTLSLNNVLQRKDCRNDIAAFLIYRRTTVLLQHNLIPLGAYGGHALHRLPYAIWKFPLPNTETAIGYVNALQALVDPTSENANDFTRARRTLLNGLSSHVSQNRAAQLHAARDALNTAIAEEAKLWCADSLLRDALKRRCGVAVHMATGWLYPSVIMDELEMQDANWPLI